LNFSSVIQHISVYDAIKLQRSRGLIIVVIVHIDGVRLRL